MTSVARLIEKIKRTQVAAKLVPGRVVYCRNMVLGTPRRVVRNKYLVFLGTALDMHQVLIINTRPAPFIAANKHLLDDQVPLDKTSHPFLDHDSFVDCHEMHDVNIRELENALVAEMDDIKGVLSDGVRTKIVEVVRDSVNLMPLHQDYIAGQLKP